MYKCEGRRDDRVLPIHISTLRVPSTGVFTATLGKKRDAYLDVMGFPPGHRAHFVVCFADIIKSMRAVDAHAAFSEMMRLRVPYTGGCVRAQERVKDGDDVELALGRRAWEDSDMSSAYFSAKRVELELNGFCMFEGMLSDAAVPGGGPATYGVDTTGTPPVVALMEYVGESFDRYVAEYMDLIERAKADLQKRREEALAKVKEQRLRKRRELYRARNPGGKPKAVEAESDSESSSSSLEEDVQLFMDENQDNTANDRLNPDEADEWISITNKSKQAD